MRNISLLAGIVATTIGLAAVSTGSAFAMGCLTNQEDLPVMSLSHDAMVPNEGFGYDKSTYDADLAKGNACGATQQSQPVSDTRSVNGKKAPQARYN